MMRKILISTEEKKRILRLQKLNEGSDSKLQSELIDIQEILKMDYSLNLGPSGIDGQLGPFTLDAILAAINSNNPDKSC